MVAANSTEPTELMELLDQLNEKVVSLSTGVDELDQDVERAFVLTIEKLVKALLPVLKHIDRPLRRRTMGSLSSTLRRGIIVCKLPGGEYLLVLDRTGGFLLGGRSGRDDQEVVVQQREGLAFDAFMESLSFNLSCYREEIPFLVIKGLANALQRAISKAEERQKKMRERLALLKSVIAQIQT